MQITSRHIRWLLLGGIAFFVVCHLIAVMLEFTQPDGTVEYWTRLFDLDQEYNVPTVYNGLLLTFAGAFSIIAFLRQRSVWWIGLGLLFIYLALDEMLLIHEQIAAPLRTLLALDNASPFFHAWVIPGIVLSVLMGAYLLYVGLKKKTINFTPNTLVLYVFALAVGAVLIEIVSTKTYGNIIFYRLVSVVVEEVYEMGFSSLILYRVLRSLNN